MIELVKVQEWAQRIVSEFENSRQKARHNMQREATVCVLGEYDYLDLETALRVKFEGMMKKTTSEKGLTYGGVRIYSAGPVVLRMMVFGADPAD